MAESFKVLFVCTANVCRSPLAAAVLAGLATERSLPIVCASAGVAPGGEAVDPKVVTVMRDWGVDLSAKVSQQLTPKFVQAADLVLTMTSLHARRVIGEDPACRSKVFMLRELAEMPTRVGCRHPAEPVQHWISRADAARELSYFDRQPEYSVPDPLGLPLDDFFNLRDEFYDYSEILVEALSPVMASLTSH